jgi:hypothetical protein
METNTKDITHALDKIAECARNLKAVTTTVHTTDYRHNIFQLAYNAGRLSELTGEGRKIYDELKPEIASGLLSGWNTIENVIVPQWREKFLKAQMDPDRQLHFASYRIDRRDREDRVMILEKIEGGYYARIDGAFLNHGNDRNGTVLMDGVVAIGRFKDGAAELLGLPECPRFFDTHEQTYDLVAEELEETPVTLH